MKIELCAASTEAINFAKKHNFDRIELCQNLEQGGLTPSDGLIQYAIEKGVSTHVLIRVRPGGFVYNNEEVEVMLSDIKRCVQLGVDGVVIGALTVNGEIDTDIIEQMISCAKNLEVTFHRAFDECRNVERSITTLIELGFERILSSGTKANVEEGIDVLKEMKEFSNGRIEIMTGGGVSIDNVKRLMNKVDPDAIHFSGTKNQTIDEYSMFSESILVADEDKILAILAEIKK